MRYLEEMNAKLALFASSAALASFALACGSPPVPPSSTSAPAGVGGVGQGGDPSGAAPAQGSTVTSGAPASPMEGGCREGAPKSDAPDLAKCLDSCKGMDDTVPLGSRCISAKASCTSLCNTKFKK